MIGTAPGMAANVILPAEPLVLYTVSPPPVITAANLPNQAGNPFIPVVVSTPMCHGFAGNPFGTLVGLLFLSMLVFHNYQYTVLLKKKK